MQPAPRLYETFQPKTYRLDLTINREARTFSGIVSITGEKFGDAPIAFHAKDLVITNIQVGDTIVPYTQHEYDELRLDALFVPGVYQVTIEFNGAITDPMTGMYPCYYSENGVKKELIMTQFESHHAREVFPCIDEPEAKAIFDLTLVTEPDVTVLSNAPILKSKIHPQAGGLKSTTFQTTPRMSTYLLAWVIGDLHHESATTKNGTEVRVYGTKAQPVETFTYPLARAVDLIEFYEDYFGVPYPLAKCDHVAVPDFSAAAMENWGLITYRESCLLITDSGSPSLKQYITTVIAHELAHQWFGNLVTMKWWDDLWLNESVANIMRYIAIDALSTECNIWHMFHTLETTIALSRDQLPSIQPVLHEINHPDDIGPAFDKAITYAKGSRIIRMMIELMGHEEFRVGMKRYFDTYAYSNTSRTDLWNSLASDTHDIPTFMTEWLSRPGFPIVSVVDGQLRQHRFNGHDSQPWPLPIWHSGQWQMLDESSLLSESPIINHNAIGHYIVSYDDTSFDRLINSFDTLSPVEQAEAIYEHALLAQSGDTTTERLVRLLHLARHSDQDVVWGTITIVLTMLSTRSLTSPHYEKLQENIRRFIAPALKTYGTTPRDNESDNDRKIRSILLQLGILAHDDTLIQQLHARYTELSIDQVAGAEQYALLAATIINDPSAYEPLLSRYTKLQNGELRENLMHALTCSQRSEHIDQLIRALTNPDRIKPQNLPWLFLGLLRNPHAQAKIWQWLESHWDWIERTYQGDSLIIEKFAIYGGVALTGDEGLQRYDQFFAAHTIKGGERAIATAKEAIALRTAWQEREPTIALWYDD